MIRPTKSEQGKRTIITIDGQVAGENLGAVELFCKQTLSKGKSFDICLRDALTIDDAGWVLLSRLVAKGIRLLAREAYTSPYCSDAGGSVGRPFRPQFECETVIGSVEPQVQI
jgi:hypothetical protein